MVATYEVQTNGSEWSEWDQRNVAVSRSLLFELFEHGVTFAALDIYQGDNYHNVKIRINRDV